jgi:hypothetical protein
VSHWALLMVIAKATRIGSCLRSSSKAPKLRAASTRPMGISLPLLDRAGALLGSNSSVQQAGPEGEGSEVRGTLGVFLTATKRPPTWSLIWAHLPFGIRALTPLERMVAPDLDSHMSAGRPPDSSGDPCEPVAPETCESAPPNFDASDALVA